MTYTYSLFTFHLFHLQSHKPFQTQKARIDTGLFQYSSTHAGIIKWRRRDSNPRPQRCERCALPTELRPHIMSGPVIGPDFYVVLSDSTIIAPFYKKERGISTFFHLPVSPCLYSLLISLCGGRKGSRDSSGGQRRHLRGCCSRCSEAGSQNRS